MKTCILYRSMLRTLWTVIGLGAISYTFAQESFSVENVRLLLDGGNKYTQSHVVTLKIEAAGARQMKVSRFPNLDGAEWQEFKADYGAIHLGQEEGEKKVYVQLKDKYGNESPIIEGKIILDRTPPKNPKVTINAEGGFVNNPERIVSLEVHAEDAKYMMISNSSTFKESRWQGYRSHVPNWKLEAGNGLRKVFVKFRDEAGNESGVASAEIMVDDIPPLDPRISINGDQRFTNDPQGKVTLSIFARGATEMKVSEKSDFSDAEWQPYKTTLDWKFSQEPQGERTVYVKFRDQAQNESTVASDNIIFDNTPPENCSLIINGGAKYAEDPDRFVELRLSAKGAVFMMISNYLNFAGARWEPFREVVPKWRLTEENGEKTIYVRFKDEYGNETGVVKASIILAI
ncbi:MAG: hypothetical protein RMJ44_03910 [Cytophagales bacterium]|nr:hypothetical protein [Bernardetiaceae bacterium]MDW8210208.1 hypothetical protein [Cytophagales bacterium]